MIIDTILAGGTVGVLPRGRGGPVPPVRQVGGVREAGNRHLTRGAIGFRPLDRSISQGLTLVVVATGIVKEVLPVLWSSVLSLGDQLQY